MSAPELNIEPLRQWGFAPGSYMCMCSDCGKQHIADKRAWRCLECAEKRVGLIAEAVAREREECAAIAEKEGDGPYAVKHIAAAIRARGQD
jgi:hypothetical protein